MLYSIGQRVPYLYKVNKEEFTIEATIIALNGTQVGIEFINPNGGYKHRRTLRTAKERARLVDYQVPRRGAPDGNRNAAKNGPHRQLVTLSLKEQRLERMIGRLQKAGKEVNRKNLQELAYEAIDVYMGL